MKNKFVVSLPPARVYPIAMENDYPILPTGFRFLPNDQELFAEYLDKKIKNLPLPCQAVIYNVNLYDYPPDYLAATHDDMGEKEWYFFTVRDRKHMGGMGKKTNRILSTGEGYWKCTTYEAVRYEGAKVGFKRGLVFYRGKPNDQREDNKKTNWLMNEYSIDTSMSGYPDNNNEMQLDIVLCRIYNKDHKKRADLSTLLSPECPTPAPAPAPAPAPVSSTASSPAPASSTASAPAPAVAPTSASPSASASAPPQHNYHVIFDCIPDSPAPAPPQQNSHVLSDCIPDSPASAQPP